MRKVLQFLTIVALFVGLPALDVGQVGAAQEGPGCEGQWRLQITFDGRDLVEEAIAVFDADGALVWHTPPVVPALPEMGDEPLYASDTVGSWAGGSGVHCTFDVVRLLAAEDGAPLGAVNIRGGIVLDESGPGLTGTFTYDQSSGPGRTVASGGGTVVGTSMAR